MVFDEWLIGIHVALGIGAQETKLALEPWLQALNNECTTKLKLLEEKKMEKRID